MSIIKKHRNLIIFILLTLIRSVFMGMMKFYLWSYLKEIRTLQEIAGYASLWWTIAYLVGGTVAYAFTKKKIIVWSALVCIICLVVGSWLHYAPFLLFALLLSIIGFMYSLWLTIKSVILSTEIMTSWLGETLVNGLTNVSILVGFLLGSYLWFWAHSAHGTWWFLRIIALLVLCALLSLFFTYDKLFTGKPFMATLRHSMPNILNVTEKYFWILVPIGVLWAVGMVMGQKMLQMWIEDFSKMPAASVFILVVYFVWAIVGNMISAFIKTNKKLITIVFIIIAGRSVILFPHFIHTHENYLFLKMYSFAIGVFCGIATNILEGRFFHRIGDNQEKEYWAAAYGIITSILMFFIMIISDLLTLGFGDKFAYFFCGIVILINIFFIGHLHKRQETGESA